MVWPFNNKYAVPLYAKGRVYKDSLGNWVGINRFGSAYYAVNWGDAMQHAML